MKYSKLGRHWKRAPELVRAWRLTPAWREVFVRYLEIGRPSYPFRFTLSGGGTIETTSPGELQVFWQIFVHRCYRIPHDCTTIVDAGANIGLFALWAAWQRPAARIVSLEPFPETFEQLEKNIRTNSLQERIRAVRGALAGKTGDRRLNAFGESPNHRLVQPGAEVPADDSLVVSCVTLTDFLREERLESLDLLKMDIEGSEWEVLFSTPSAILGNIRHIILEYHEVHARFGYHPEKLFAHLANAGHKLTYREEDVAGTGLAFFQRSLRPHTP